MLKAIYFNCFQNAFDHLKTVKTGVITKVGESFVWSEKIKRVNLSTLGSFDELIPNKEEYFECISLPDRDDFDFWVEDIGVQFFHLPAIRNKNPLALSRHFNMFSFLGFNDWRPPTAYEISSIRDKKLSGIYRCKDPSSIKSNHYDTYNGKFYNSDSNQVSISITPDSKYRAEDHFRSQLPERLPDYSLLLVRGHIHTEFEWLDKLVSYCNLYDFINLPCRFLEIANMTSLELTHRGTSEIEIPLELIECSKFKKVNISGVKIKNINESFYYLKHFEEVILRNVDLVNIDSKIGEFENLVSLSVDDSVKVSDSIMNLASLKLGKFCTKHNSTKKMDVWVEEQNLKGNSINEPKFYRMFFISLKEFNLYDRFLRSPVLNRMKFKKSCISALDNKSPFQVVKEVHHELVE
jgi:hypothetical protein